MKVKDIRKQINGILGNSLRCILPSYWFKRIFNIIVDKIEELEYNSDNINKLNTKVITLSNKVDNITPITVDSSIIEGSSNPVQSRVIKKYIDDNTFEIREIKYNYSGLTSAEKSYNADTFAKLMAGENVIIYDGSATNQPRKLLSVEGYNFITEIITLRRYEGKLPDATTVTYTLTSEGDVTQETYLYDQLSPDTAMSDTSTNVVQNKTIKTYVDKLKVIEVLKSGITQIELKPNVLYKLSEITNLNITFDTNQTDMVSYYMFELEVGDIIPTITCPEDIKWMNGYNILENLTINTTYQISILNNLAVGGAF